MTAVEFGVIIGGKVVNRWVWYGRVRTCWGRWVEVWRRRVLHAHFDVVREHGSLKGKVQTVVWANLGVLRRHKCSLFFFFASVNCKWQWQLIQMTRCCWLRRCYARGFLCNQRQGL